MEDRSFHFTNNLTRRMLRLRFENDKLFKTRKRPWLEFYNILLQNGFPPEMTLGQLRKKWSYTWDVYKIAKKEKNKHWKYYKMFEKHFAKNKTLDKYESWSNKTRLKLITFITDTEEHDLEPQTMWRVVERAMRFQGLPEDCCVQDMQGLWHHIKTTFLRKHRIKLRRPEAPSDWPLYEPMLEYFGRFKPEQLVNMQAEKDSFLVIPKAKSSNADRRRVDGNENLKEFHWSKDITESFIQIRMQNEWLFNERLQAWKDFVVILKEEHGFPDTITPREASKKWASTYADYQKAKATDNKLWVYYNIFELYLGEGSMNMNPLTDWQETWVHNLIEMRTSLEHFFIENSKLDPCQSWREVEKRLRSNGIPLNHNLIDLPNIWAHLIRTYKWKRKFADKGVLKEQWPYFEAMTNYIEVHEKSQQKHKQKVAKKERTDYDDGNDDYEDDMKLLDLKQKIDVDLKPKYLLVANQCRACACVDGSVDIYEHKDEDGVDFATKLHVVGGIEVERSDSLPTQICYSCLQELETAYKFRRKCQAVDKDFRDSSKTVKTEILDRNDDSLLDLGDDGTDMETNDDITMSRNENGENITSKSKLSKEQKPKKKYGRYDYWKICDICGVQTKNLKGHIDSHNNVKPYSCEICGKKFKFKNGLFLHKSVHDPTPRKTCEICGKSFHIMAHYRRHFVHHANERKFACDTCGKRFNSLDILRVHVRIHTDERPFSCSECGKTFRTAGCVSRHKRIVHKIMRKVE